MRKVAFPYQATSYQKFIYLYICLFQTSTVQLFLPLPPFSVWLINLPAVDGFRKNRPWETAATCAWGRADCCKNPALNSKSLGITVKAQTLFRGLLPTVPSPFTPPIPRQHWCVGTVAVFRPQALRTEQGVPAVARAARLLDAIRPKLINQTLSMNENVIKEINCRNTCTNKNPLTYLPGIPVRKH